MSIDQRSVTEDDPKLAVDLPPMGADMLGKDSMRPVGGKYATTPVA
jgi:hypothetical protein